VKAGFAPPIAAVLAVAVVSALVGVDLWSLLLVLLVLLLLLLLLLL